MSNSDLAPTDIELEILKAFWRLGPLAAREVHDQIAVDLGWSLSTTRTMLERMRAKRLLERSSVHGVAVYRHSRPKVEILNGLMRRLSNILEMDRALPAAAFTGSQILDEDDLSALEALLNADAGGDDDDA